MGIIVKYFGRFYLYFFVIIIWCIYVYIVNGNYLCAFIPIKKIFIWCKCICTYFYGTFHN